MTTPPFENIEHPQVWFRTREQTARLLEELHELYQSLSCAEQKLIRGEFLGVAGRQRFFNHEEF